jgi:hypothetical protein
MLIRDDAEKLRKIVRNIRKIVKFLRGPTFVQNLFKKKISLPKVSLKSNENKFIL